MKTNRRLTISMNKLFDDYSKNSHSCNSVKMACNSVTNKNLFIIKELFIYFE